ncbi:MAG: TRAP transporter small permease subunit [Desulfobacteraceae bacterium]|nr:MAG: TRAP transporter small permease subunit [Desulfobacteraceae bacterium]
MDKEAMEGIKKFVGAVDSISEWSGRIACWIIVPLVMGTVYDVLMRYLFKSPTKWAYELTWMEYAALFMLGGAYGLRHHVHVRVDVLYNKYPPRVQAVFDALMYLLFFFPLYILLIVYGTKYAAYSWTILENSYLSYWQPPVYPIKTLIPVAFTLFFVQGIAEFIRNATFAIKGKAL